MKLWQIVGREIAYRKLNFVLSLAAVALAVTVVVVVVALARGQEELHRQEVAALDNEIRKITKDLGFNILILPAEQNLAEFHSANFAAETMPESFVNRLAESPDVVTINHLRPALIRKLDWPEQNRQIVLMGVKGVVPFLHRDPKKPLALPVPPGKINVGGVLAAQVSLKADQTVKLHGQQFTVDKIYPPRGNIDDITVWIDLDEAQALLNMPEKINMIQALECNCASIDRLGEIQQEISGVLGSEVQVIELASQAIARAKARNQVKSSGEARLAQWKTFAALVNPVVVVVSCLWVGMLSLANVRQRRSELGIWRALGWRSRHILALFLSKAALVGIVGAAAGLGLGLLVLEVAGGAGGQPLESGLPSGAVVDPSLPLAVYLLVGLSTPLLCLLASWLPAFFAAMQDPSELLRED